MEKEEDFVCGRWFEQMTQDYGRPIYNEWKAETLKVFEESSRKS